MNYIPDTCFNDNRVDNELYLILQIRYRNGFIKYLSQFIDFKSVCNLFDESIIPSIDDEKYNFYHRNSLLHNKYLYIRNNIHIEKLSNEELLNIKSLDDKYLNNNFYENTYKKVMFEEGSLTSYGLYPTNENLKKSQAIIFEFAYDQKKCESIEQLKQISSIISKAKNMLQDSMDKANINVDFLVYKCIPDIFETSDLDNK